MRISDWSSDVCSSDLHVFATHDIQEQATRMANPKPDARTRFRRSTRDGADGSTQRRLTSDRISADLADFQKAGGQVAVLGVTRVLKKLGESAGERADEKAAQPRSEERRVGKDGVITCAYRGSQ